MVLRIALVVGFVFIFTGFKAPRIPRESRGVYSFEPVNGGMGFQTQSGGLFSLTVGFKPEAIESRARGNSLHENAQAIVDKLADRLNNLRLPATEITVGKLYATTHEIIINVRVEDAGQTESVRAQLTKHLSKTPGVAFVGAPGVVRIE